MILIVGVGIGDAREQILIALARQQITVVERLPAEIGKQFVARGIGDDRKAPLGDRLGIFFFRPGGRIGNASQRFGCSGDQCRRSGIASFGHGEGRLFVFFGFD